MKLPRNFFKPLAIGAPAPLRDLPVKLERMIHFVPPHVEKLRAKVPELIAQVDVVLGNLEDAIPADAKAAARSGFIAMAKANDFGATGLWTRINCLNSPCSMTSCRSWPRSATSST
jgi:malyl-CoA/(S)-citramalyl-CoA lyase